MVPTFVYSCTKQRIITKVKENLLSKHILSLTVNMSNGPKSEIMSPFCWTPLKYIMTIMVWIVRKDSILLVVKIRQLWSVLNCSVITFCLQKLIVPRTHIFWLWPSLMSQEQWDLELGDMFICTTHFMFHTDGTIWLTEEICRKIHILGNPESPNWIFSSSSTLYNICNIHQENTYRAICNAESTWITSL